MTQPRLLVFDLDGTLIDSSTDLCHSVNAMLQFLGKPPLASQVIASFIGDGAATLVRRAIASADTGQASPAATGTPEADAMQTPSLPDARFQAAYAYFLGYYREHKLDNTRVYEGVLPALESLRAQAPRLPMAVLTNKPVRPSREICAALDLAPFFFQNYGGDSFASKKPDPEGLLAVIAEASALSAKHTPGAPALLPAQVVMVGDSGVDVQTARRCGARSLGCTFGLSPGSLAEAVPDLSVDSPQQWPGALGFT